MERSRSAERRHDRPLSTSPPSLADIMASLQGGFSGVHERLDGVVQTIKEHDSAIKELHASVGSLEQRMSALESKVASQRDVSSTTSAESSGVLNQNYGWTGRGIIFGGFPKGTHRETRLSYVQKILHLVDPQGTLFAIPYTPYLFGTHVFSELQEKVSHLRIQEANSSLQSSELRTFSESGFPATNIFIARLQHPNKRRENGRLRGIRDHVVSRLKLAEEAVQICYGSRTLYFNQVPILAVQRSGSIVLRPAINEYLRESQDEFLASLTQDDNVRLCS